MINWFKSLFKKPNNTTAVVAVMTKPLLINPEAKANLDQKRYRIDAITRYVAQRKLENRPIPTDKLTHLADEKTRLELEISALEKQIIADGGVV